MSLIFRQLQDLRSSTYTYLLADSASREAVLIDPVFDQVQRDEALLRELGLELAYTLDTHVHADHVTGAWLLKERTGSRIVISKASGADGADLLLEHGDRVSFGDRYVQARATPGHTNGCMTYVLDDKSMAFTGDALLIRGAGRTDFQQGDPHTLFLSVTEQILSLPDDCVIYPGHDYRGLTASSVVEERKFNPRLGGERNENDFVGYMQNLGLPHPKQMDEAVPANLKCGHVGADKMPAIQDWAPLKFTYGGAYEIDCDWLAEHTEDVQIIDVRAAAEFTGILGHITGASLIPLEELAEQSSQFDRDRPVVTVCRAGGRSIQAAIILQKNGFGKVASLGGGMIAWNNHGLPVDDGD